MASAHALATHFAATDVEPQADASRDDFLIPYAPLAGSLDSCRVELSAVLSVRPLSLRMASNDTDNTGTLFVQFPTGKVRRRS